MEDFFDSILKATDVQSPPQQLESVSAATAASIAALDIDTFLQNAPENMLNQHCGGSLLDLSTDSSQVGKALMPVPAPSNERLFSIGNSVSPKDRRRSSSEQPPTRKRAALDEEALKERRLKNRKSSRNCYYKRVEKVRAAKKMLNFEKERLVNLFNMQLELRKENADLTQLIVKNNPNSVRFLSELFRGSNMHRLPYERF